MMHSSWIALVGCLDNALAYDIYICQTDAGLVLQKQLRKELCVISKFQQHIRDKLFDLIQHPAVSLSL